MDLIASFGYNGQELTFLDAERFSHHNGKGIYMYDINKGPKEVHWRHEKDVRQVCINVEAGLLALSFSTAEQQLEIANLSELSTPTVFENPYNCAITHMDIARTGERLVGISDVTDHRLTIWNLNTDSGVPKVAAAKKLDFIAKKVYFNPCDVNQILIYGNDSVYKAVVHEVFEVYSLKVEKIFPIHPPPVDRMPGASSTILFSIWLPFNRLIVGIENGEVYEVHCDSKEAKYLGRFVDASLRSHSHQGILLASCAAISSQYFIIGTHDGSVYWYPIGNLLNEAAHLEDGQDNFFHQPLRVLKIGQPIASLAIDPTFSTLVIGTYHGTIMKAALESDAVNDLDHKNDHDEEQEHVKKIKCETVKGESVGNDSLGGVAITSKFLSLGIKKTSSRSKSTLSTLLLGSHDGLLSIWRHSSPGTDIIPSVQGIRRSMPRMMKEIIRFPLQTRDAAIVAMEYIFYGPNTAILCLGLDNGMLEFWYLTCTEQEEDDTKEVPSSLPSHFTKMVEDDEGSILTKFEIVFLLKTQVYESAFSSLRVQVESSTEVKLVATSVQESAVYVFSVIKNANLEIGKIASSFDVSCGGQVVNTVFMDEFLFAITNDRSLMRYMMLANSGVEPEMLKLTAFGAIANFCVSPHLNSGIIVNSQGLAYYFTFSDDFNNRIVWDKIKNRKLTEHKDLISCVAYSPNGNLFALGSIDGAISIWKVEGDTCNDIILTNTLEIHSAAIISVVFSADSSTVFTSCVDGTCNMLFTGGKSVSKNRQGSMLASKTSTSVAISLDDDFSINELQFESNEVVLKEKVAAEEEKELRAQHKFKCMGISAAINEIVQRLSILVQQNNERSPLEQLPRDEFVINLQKKEEVEQHNTEQANALRDSYKRRQKWLELLSARLRMATWDKQQTSAIKIRPFINPPDLDPLHRDGVTSFSVPHFGSKEAKYLEKVKRLRRLEVRSIKKAEESGSIRRIKGTNYFRCSWATNVAGCPSDISYVVNDGLLWPLNKIVDTNEVAVNKDGDGKDKAAAGGATAGSLEDDERSFLSNDEDVDVDEQDFLNLVYVPQVTRTSIQKRNQMLFLKEIVKRIKDRFNATFAHLQQEKEDIVQFVNSRNERMQEILTELHIHEDIWRPKMAQDERKNNIITVYPEELTSTPYESEAVKLQRQKEAEERALKQQSDENEVTKTRALDDMMHGTLEVKRDVLAEALSTHKPAWMDELTPAEMSESQLKEFDAYKEKLRALQEQQAHYKKTLEQEMKKLKSEIVETCKFFNDKLENIGKEKILVGKEVLSQEMYIAMIANTVVKAESCRTKLKKTEESLQITRKERTELKSRIEKFAKNYEELKNKLLAIQEDEKSMEKTFRRDLQNLCNNTFDQESLKVFTQLYRHRVYPRAHHNGQTMLGGDNDQSEIDVSASGNSSRMKRSKDVSGKQHSATGGKHNRSQSKAGKTAKAGGGKMKASRNVSAGGGGGGNSMTNAAMGPMQQAAQALRSQETEAPSYKEKDPFYGPILYVQKQKKSHEAVLPILAPLSMEADCPEGFVVDQFSWAKLQELRNARMEKEIEGKLLMNELHETKSKLQVLDDEEVQFTGLVNETRGQRDSTQDQLKNVETNLTMLIRLLQGQDEVDSDAAVTDYTSSALLPCDVIGKYNSRIKELGSEKIGVLSKIKLFRRKINAIAWEARHQGYQAKHFESYYTDLQLFRVTRDLQKVILEGADAFNQKERVEKINTRKDYLQKEHQGRNAIILEKLEAFQKQIREREVECRGLQEQIAELDSQVYLSNSIKKSRETALGPASSVEINASMDKMKRVVKRRQLVDMARAQAEEIDYLRQELDRMRQRTFPSFVK